MGYNAKNYTEQGGEVTHIGGSVVFDDGGAVKGGFVPNIEADTPGSDNVSKVRASLNGLITALKDGGVIVGDPFTMNYAAVTDTVEGHADRQFNTGKISSVVIGDDNTITITLSSKVSDLKDFDGGNGWGVHKWLGIGLGVGINPITGLKYNGSALTSGDVEEATACSLSAGYFVRWVAADLVLTGDNSQKSVDNFKLWASGYAETEYKIVIVEPTE